MHNDLMMPRDCVRSLPVSDGRMIQWIRPLNERPETEAKDTADVD